MEALLVWGIVLLVVALLLVVVEIFVPSAGLISITAALVGIAGLICLYKVDFVWGISGTLAAVVLVPTIIYYGFQTMPSTYFGRKMLFGESGEHEPVLKTDGVDEFAALVGMEGDALTDLRPVGVAKIGKERLDVLSEVSYVRAGARVRVTAVEGTTVKVRPVA